MMKALPKNLVSVEQFKDKVLIQCPNCKKCALLRSTQYSHSERKWTCDCLCEHCAKTWQFHPGGYALNDSRPYLCVPLWLQTRCKNHVLWAFNEKHLQFLEDYISQTLRKRPLNFNGSLQSRLPRWILSAKNRTAVASGVRRLRAKLSAI